MKTRAIAFLIVLAAAILVSGSSKSEALTSCSDAITNGGFESSLFPGWQIGAGNILMTRSAHSGSWAVQLNVASPYNGDNELLQTISIPPANKGETKVSFWYNPHCTGTLATDWQQAEIRSTQGVLLRTLLNACSNSGTWTQVTADLTTWAGSTVVLRFNAHDDGAGAQ